MPTLQEQLTARGFDVKDPIGAYSYIEFEEKELDVTLSVTSHLDEYRLVCFPTSEDSVNLIEGDVSDEKIIACVDAALAFLKQVKEIREGK